MENQNILIIALVAIVAVVAVVLLVSNPPTLNQENVAGQAHSIASIKEPLGMDISPKDCCFYKDEYMFSLSQEECKKYGGQWYSPCKVSEEEKDECCKGSDGEFYFVSGSNLEEVCKDRYQGFLVDSSYCEGDSEVCCEITDSQYGVWVPSDIHCEAMNGNVVPLAEDKCGMACCKDHDGTSWMYWEDCEQIGGDILPGSTQERCESLTGDDPEVSNGDELGCCYDFNPIYTESAGTLFYVDGEDQAFMASQEECEALGVGSFWHEDVAQEDCNLELANYCCCTFDDDGSSHTASLTGHPEYCDGTDTTTAVALYYDVDFSQGIHCEEDICAPYRESIFG